MKHILLIGGHDETFNHYQGLNLKFSVLQRQASLGPNLKALTDKVHVVNDLHYETLLKSVSVIHKEDPIDCIFSFTEDGLLSTALVADKFGIKGLDLPSCKMCVDKAHMRDHLMNTRFSLDYAICDSLEDAEQFLMLHPDGMVLKDPNGSGSENVFFASSKEDLSMIFKATIKNNKFGFLAEEYIDGCEVSVETLTIRGNHEVIAVTEKKLYRNSLAEQQHIQPVTCLSDSELCKAKSYCLELLDAIAYQHGPCHIEIKIGSKGVRLIEINNRVGGDYIGHLVDLTTGVNLFRETLMYLFEGYPSMDNRDNRKKFRFAASHAFFKHFSKEHIHAALAEMTILKLELDSNQHSSNPVMINEDAVGRVVFASNNPDIFYQAISNLETLTGCVQ